MCVIDWFGVLEAVTRDWMSEKGTREGKITSQKKSGCSKVFVQVVYVRRSQCHARLPSSLAINI